MGKDEPNAKLHPLHYAVMMGYDHRVRSLVAEGGVDVTSQDSKGFTALDWAIGCRRIEAVKILLENGADVQLFEGPRPNRPLRDAVLDGTQPIIQLLLEYGADPKGDDGDGQTILTLAEQRAERRSKIVETLEATAGAGTSACKRREYEKRKAQERRDFGSREEELDRGEDYSRFHYFPLHWAIREGHIDIVEILLQKDGIDIEQRDHLEMTPLGKAVNAGRCDIAALLLDKGAKIDACYRSRAGVEGSALLHAVRGDDVEMVKLLVKKGANPGISNRVGTTPLELAKRRQERYGKGEEIVALLESAQPKKTRPKKKRRRAKA